MHKNYRKTLCKHTNFQKIKKNKNRHNAQKYNNFLCKIPLNRIIKKSSQCTKKIKKKSFFVQK